jgi:hypothetical protein
MRFEKMRSAKCNSSAGLDWNFHIGFGIAAYTLTLIADREDTERRELHSLASG